MCDPKCPLLVNKSDVERFIPIKNSFCIFKDTKQLYSKYSALTLSSILKYADVFYPAFRSEFRKFIATYWSDYQIGFKTKTQSVYRHYSPCIAILFDNILPELGIVNAESMTILVDIAKPSI